MEAPHILCMISEDVEVFSRRFGFGDGCDFIEARCATGSHVRTCYLMVLVGPPAPVPLPSNV